MQVTFDVKGITELEEYFGGLTERIRVTFDEEAHQITDIIRIASEPYVPYRTGQLELSSNRSMVTNTGEVMEQMVEWAAYDTEGFNYALVQETEPFVHRIKPSPKRLKTARYAERGITDSKELVLKELIEIINKSIRS